MKKRYEAAELLSVLRQRIKRYESQAAFARKHSLSPSYLADVLAGRRKISPKLLTELGFQRVISYEETA